MKKYDELFYKIIKNEFKGFIVATILLLIFTLFLRNINGMLSKILGIIYVVILAITFISFMYAVINGIILSKKNNEWKNLLISSLKSCVFAVCVLMAYYLLIYRKFMLVVNTDLLIVIVFLLIPSFEYYFESHRVEKKEKKQRR